MISVATDNDSTNASMMKSCVEDEMPDGPLRRLLIQLMLFHPLSDHALTVGGYDDQHNGKNTRAIFIRNKGIKVLLFKLLRAEFIATMHTMTGIPMSRLEAMWPPPGVDDHQNVKSMVEGFQAMTKLEGLTADDAATASSNPGALNKKLKILQPLCMLARNWVFLFTNQAASLSEHVINLAEMAKTVFHLFRLKNSSVIPAATYRGIMKAISMHITNIARCQIDGTEEYYIFLAGTHMLEQLFGITRTLVGAQRNFDGMQLRERFSTVVAMFYIYLEHPDWKEFARRLTASFDHWNTKSWPGDVNPSRVNLVNGWATGFSNADKNLLKTGLFKAEDLDIDAIIAKDKTISLLHPKGNKSPVANEDGEDEDEAGLLGAGTSGGDDEDGDGGAAMDVDRISDEGPASAANQGGDADSGTAAPTTAEPDEPDEPNVPTAGRSWFPELTTDTEVAAQYESALSLLLNMSQDYHYCSI